MDLGSFLVGLFVGSILTTFIRAWMVDREYKALMEKVDNGHFEAPKS
jgi:hypothetical protein